MYINEGGAPGYGETGIRPNYFEAALSLGTLRTGVIHRIQNTQYAEIPRTYVTSDQIATHSVLVGQAVPDDLGFAGCPGYSRSQAEPGNESLRTDDEEEAGTMREQYSRVQSWYSYCYATSFVPYRTCLPKSIDSMTSAERVVRSAANFRWTREQLARQIVAERGEASQALVRP